MATELNQAARDIVTRWVEEMPELKEADPQVNMHLIDKVTGFLVDDWTYVTSRMRTRFRKHIKGAAKWKREMDQKLMEIRKEKEEKGKDEVP